MRLPFLMKAHHVVPLKKRNQRLARDLLFFFAFTLEGKHHSLIELSYNDSIVTIKSEGLPETHKPTKYTADLGVKLEITGHLTNVFMNNPPNEKILNKFKKIIKKHGAYYHIEKTGGDCSTVIISYNS